MPRFASSVQPDRAAFQGAVFAIVRPAKDSAKGEIVDWNQELLASVIWLAKAFFISLIGLGAVIVGLGRLTVWGRQFRVITAEYFNPRRHKAPLLWLALIVFMTLFSVRMNVLFSFWYNGFYSSMQNLDGKAFWLMLFVSSVLAMIDRMGVMPEPAAKPTRCSARGLRMVKRPSGGITARVSPGRSWVAAQLENMPPSIGRMPTSSSRARA